MKQLLTSAYSTFPKCNTAARTENILQQTHKNFSIQIKILLEFITIFTQPDHVIINTTRLKVNLLPAHICREADKLHGMGELLVLLTLIKTTMIHPTYLVAVRLHTNLLYIIFSFRCCIKTYIYCERRHVLQSVHFIKKTL